MQRNRKCKCEVVLHLEKKITTRDTITDSPIDISHTNRIRYSANEVATPTAIDHARRRTWDKHSVLG